MTMIDSNDPLAVFFDVLDPLERLHTAPPAVRQTLTTRVAAATGWTDAELAMILGMKRSTAGAWRKGPEHYSRAQLTLLAEALAQRHQDIENLLDELARRGA